MEKAQLKQIVEALIFAADMPLPISQINALIDDANVRDIKKAVAELNVEYTNTNRSFQITELAGGYQMVTHESFAPWLRKFFEKQIRTRLSQAALETLSVVAFRQPIAKSDIEAIRGVNCDGVIKTLLERRMVTISGRAEGPGRPLLYATTKEFLRYFGVNQISDLPKPREIEEILKQEDAIPAELAGQVDLDQFKKEMDSPDKTSGTDTGEAASGKNPENGMPASSENE